MEEKVYIEWTYTPENYFEGEVEQNRDLYSLQINNGSVRAVLVSSTYDKDNKILGRIHDEVKAFFMGTQVVSHRPYNLSKYTLYRQHSDGRKDVTVFPDSCVMEFGAGTVDVIVTDSTGKVIADTKADRIREKLEFAKLSAKHNSIDPTAKRILSSYEASVNDPANELVHLYEIRDALKKRIGSERTARTSLGISETDWKRLGSLSNNEPLRQGRHRGQNFDTLRDATNEELAEARKIAKCMVIAYLKYLDSNIP